MNDYEKTKSTCYRLKNENETLLLEIYRLSENILKLTEGKRDYCNQITQNEEKFRLQIEKKDKFMNIAEDNKFSSDSKKEVLPSPEFAKNQKIEFLSQ